MGVLLAIFPQLVNKLSLLCAVLSVITKAAKIPDYLLPCYVLIFCLCLGGCCQGGSPEPKLIVGGWGWAWACVSDVQR
jgi:hypothetical protein